MNAWIEEHLEETGAVVPVPNPKYIPGLTFDAFQRKGTGKR